MKHTYKVMAGIVFLAVAIGATSIYSYYMLNNTSSKIEKSIFTIEQSIHNNDWDKVNENLSTVEKEWSKTKKPWAVMLDHIEIDNIDITLSRLSSYAEMKNSSLALAETTALKQYISHIPDKESTNLENIF